MKNEDKKSSRPIIFWWGSNFFRAIFVQVGSMSKLRSKN